MKMRGWYKRYKNTRVMMKVAIIQAKRWREMCRVVDNIDPLIWKFLDTAELFTEKTNEPDLVWASWKDIMRKDRIFWDVLYAAIEKNIPVHADKYKKLNSKCLTLKAFVNTYQREFTDWKSKVGYLETNKIIGEL